MKLTFFEVYGDPVRDGQLSTLREGSAELPVSEDTLLNGPVGATDTCYIKEQPYELGSLKTDGQVFEGIIAPFTRYQRLVRFSFIKPSTGQSTTGRIILLEGTLERGEAIQEITQVTDTSARNSEAMICFTPGSMVLTAFGEIPIEHLRPGDLVHTADNGLQPLKWVGKREISSTRLHVAEHLRPVEIKANAFGPGLPARNMLVSPYHRMLVDNMQASLLFGQEEVLAPARGLVNGSSITVDPGTHDICYIHLLFDEHQIIFVDSMPTESFFACPNSLMSLEEDSRRGVLDVLPQLENHPLCYSASARLALRTQEAQVLAAA